MHAPAPNDDIACLRVTDMELTYVGQAFRLGRYAIHYHMVGRTSCSYVNNSAIHRSFNRAVNVHSSHGLVIRNTTGFNIMGGAFFLEDGIEIGMFLSHTLSIYSIEINVAIFSLYMYINTEVSELGLEAGADWREIFIKQCNLMQINELVLSLCNVSVNALEENLL